MKADLTRDSFDPNAHRRTVRFQQGRVPLDADLNESQDLLVSRVETEAADVIGPAGGPVGNAGFGLSVDASGNLVLGAGRYYVDGILCELMEDTVLPAGALHSPEGVPTTDGVYLAALDVWIEHLTALEDSSMREVALHGADTATRQVIRHQVRFLPVSEDPAAPPECGEAFPQWDALTSPPTGALAARAEPEATPANDCSMTPGAGYRRLENQLYRVEIHDAGNAGSATFKWSRENGTVLVQWLGKSGNDLAISNPGRDTNRSFRSGDWVELIDRERELRGLPGTLVQLTHASGTTLTINPATASGTVDFAAFGGVPRIRRWESAGALALDHEVDADGFTALEYGVQVRFSPGLYRTGDYWMIPARTATGDVEWPRDASGNPEPELRHGIWHHFARLALVAVDEGAFTILKDCRRRFPPLGQFRTCCRLMVGDGVKSFGDFDDFDEALANLPAEGGSICFLPGEHRVTGLIRNRRHVRISGCGAASVILPRSGSVSPAVFSVVDGEQISFENLKILNKEGVGLYVGASKWLDSRGLSIRNCQVVTGYTGILIERWAEVRLLDNRLVQSDQAFGGPTCMVRAAQGRIEGNRISVLWDAQLSTEAHAWGGLQVLSGSARLVITGNAIQGGRGNGITLAGSLRDYDRARDASLQTPYSSMVQWIARQLDAGDGSDTLPEAALRDLSDASDPENLPVSQLLIRDNAISQCGLSGIGIIPPPILSAQSGFSLNANTPADSLTMDNVGMAFSFLFPTDPVYYQSRLTDSRIEDNQISGVFRLEPPPFPSVEEFGFGGIALGATRQVGIRRNQLTDFGDSAGKAVAGIFVLAGESLSIEDNEIRGSSAGDPPEEPAKGFRGGIVVRIAMKALGGNGESEGSQSPIVSPQSLEITRNTVETGMGRAVTVVAFGDIRMEDNRLQSGLTGPGGLDRVCGNTFILNLGGLLDYLRLQSVGESGLANARAPMGAVGEGFFAPVSGGTEAGDPGNLTHYAPATGLKSSSFLLFGARTQLSRNRHILMDRNVSPVGQLVFSLGDVSYSDNQSLSLQLHALPMHAMVAGTQVRALNNRLSELHPFPAISLLTGAFGNNATVHNQADHCILARSAGTGAGSVLDEGNQVLFFGLCDRLAESGNKGLAILIASSLVAGQQKEPQSEDEQKDRIEALAPQLNGLVAEHGSLVIENSTVSLVQGLTAISQAENEMVSNLESRIGERYTVLHPHLIKPALYEEQARFLKRNLELLKKREVGEPPVRELKPGHARVEGQILLNGFEAVEGAQVEILPKTGGRSFIKGQSGADGSFALDIDPATLEKLNAREVSSLKMVIRDRDGQVLKEMPAPVKQLKAGMIARGVVPLSRFRDAGPVPEDPVAPKPDQPGPPNRPKPGQPEKPIRPDKPNEPAGPGEVSLKDIKGLGSSRIFDLFKVGIRTPEDLVATPPEKLEAVLGRVTGRKVLAATRKVLKERES